MIPDPWNLSYQKSAASKPSWTKHGMPALFNDFLKLVKDEGLDGISHLDIGCGNGVKTVNFALAGFQTVGIDISKDGFTEARSLIKDLGLKKNCKVMKVNALKLPFKKNSITSASDILMFTHVRGKDYPKYFRQLLKVLKNGSLALMVLFSSKDEHFHGHKVSREYEFKFDPENPQMQEFAHYHGMVNVHFGKNDIKKTFGKDFEIIKMEEVGHPLYPYRFLWNIILRKKNAR